MKREGIWCSWVTKLSDKDGSRKERVIKREARSGDTYWVLYWVHNSLTTKNGMS